VELNRKARGDLAELKVATDLRERGYEIVFPHGRALYAHLTRLPFRGEGP
jgi:hypothetical protein